MKTHLLLFAALLTFSNSFSQEKSGVKFGKISSEDFTRTVYGIDTSAHAVVLADIGSTNVVGNGKGNFSLEFTRFRRVHILNKNGYDAASVQIGLYSSGDLEEELNSLKAVTYNLENGKIVETKLDTKSSVFKDKINKKTIVKKFTLPNLKEGSIIEYQYKIHSDFMFNLQPWEFQGAYPCIWSEYNVSVPEFYRYITLSQGYQRFYIQEAKDTRDNFSVSSSAGTERTQRDDFSAGVTDYRWVMKDVPALKEESFTSTLNNHIARIEFQLAGVSAPFVPKDIMGTWPLACADLLKDENFGYALYRDNGWLSDEVKTATGTAGNDLERAKNIFAFVRDRMTCTNYDRKYLEKPLKAVLSSRNGNEAEINLLLTAMLSKAGIKAEPVLLSTRSHGYAYPQYPLLERFNYVICKAQVDNNTYYLDASRPTLGFDRLHYDAYNGHARVVNDYATPVEFSADSLREAKLTSIIVIPGENGSMKGRMSQSPGYYESYSLRTKIKEKGKDHVFNEIKKSFNADIDITNPEVEAIDKYDEPVKLQYDFDLKTGGEDILYLNPMLGEAWMQNPFKSANRFYPVEMPYSIDETYLLRLDLPAGYVVDEIPKEIKVKLNEDEDGYFEYRIAESEGSVSLRSRIVLKRAFYGADEYTTLREFFNLIVKKHAEQIVLKKKK